MTHTRLDSSRADVLRDDFPVLKRQINGRPLVYLDSAATSLTPQPVVAALSRYYLEMGGAVHRGQHILSEEASETYERARQDVARFLGCASDEIVFVRNATEALNLVAQTLSWSPGDEVIVGAEAHHSNLLPWRRVARALAVPLREDGTWDLDRYAELLRRRPKLVALTHASNVTGIYQPLGLLAAMAADAGSLVMVDASQSLPHRRLNLRDHRIDFLAFSGHKMLGPTGIGVLYARRGRQREMNPPCVGGGSVEWVDAAGFRLRPGPQRFEAGTPNISGALGLCAAIRYLEDCGWSAIARHDSEISEIMYREVARREECLEVLAPKRAAERAGIISFRIKAYREVHDVARILSDSFGIMCRSGHMCAQPLVDALARGGVLRASAYIYNTAGEVSYLFEALDEVLVRLNWSGSTRFRSQERNSRSIYEGDFQVEQPATEVAINEKNERKGAKRNVQLGNGF